MECRFGGSLCPLSSSPRDFLTLTGDSYRENGGGDAVYDVAERKRGGGSLSVCVFLCVVCPRLFLLRSDRVPKKREVLVQLTGRLPYDTNIYLSFQSNVLKPMFFLRRPKTESNRVYGFTVKSVKVRSR